MIAIIDYGMGNLGSVKNMLRKLGGEAVITSLASEIEAADKLILPGVGSFDRGMENLEALGLIPVLNERVNDAGVPLLGICLGMQLLTEGSEEGSRPGLGWIRADTVRFAGPEIENAGLRVPHMGWNVVSIEQPHPLVDSLDADSRFYFVHSYWVRCKEASDLVASSLYGHRFAAVVARGNVMGTQFHPEKSHNFGMKLLASFAEVVVGHPS